MKKRNLHRRRRGAQLSAHLDLATDLSGLLLDEVLEEFEFNALPTDQRMAPSAENSFLSRVVHGRRA